MKRRMRDAGAELATIEAALARASGSARAPLVLRAAELSAARDPERALALAQEALDALDALDALAPLGGSGELARPDAAEAPGASGAPSSTQARARATAVLASVAFTRGDYPRAVSLATSMRALLGDGGDPLLLSRAHGLEGGVALEQARLDDALASYLAALEQATRSGDPGVIGAAQHNIGLVHWRMGDLDRAAESIEAAIVTLAPTGDPRALGNTLNSTGLVEHERGHFAQALESFGRAREALRASGDRSFSANVEANVADTLEAMGDLAGALEHGARALSLREEVSHKRGICGSHLALARVLLASGRAAEAEPHLAAGRALAEALSLAKHAADAELLAATLAEARGDFEQAYRASQRHRALRERVWNDERATRIAQMQARFEANRAREQAARERLAREAIAREKAAAEAHSQAKSDFLAMLGHEVRNPLHALLLAARVLSSRLRGEEPRALELLGVVRSSGEALAGIVDRLLDLARLESGRLRLEIGRFSIETLARDVVAAATAGDEPRVPVELVIDPTTPELRSGDPIRVRQILENLVGNALKATTTGLVEVRVSGDEERLRLTVRDTGSGIEPALLARLFEPFTRGDDASSSAPRRAGLGLGLSIARGLARAMDGDIAVRSERDQGTTFEVTLAVPAVLAPEDRPSVRAIAGADVLIVDDDAAARDLLIELLARMGCSARGADGAASALEAALARAPDLVLMDLEMPGTDGLEAARRMRRAGVACRIVALTGTSTERERAAAEAAGMDGWLTKPVAIERLTLEIAAGRASAARGSVA